MAKGDHIKVDRSFYWHHGIDIGNGTVIHFTGGPGNKADAEITMTSIEEFLNGGIKEIVNYSLARLPDEVVQTALSHIGQKDYSLIFNNCEHFARYCKTGDFKSEQVTDAVATTGGSAAATAGVYLSIAAIATAGPVVGLSGPGIMSGLAAIGPGGVVGGVITLATAPAVFSNLAVNKILEDDKKLEHEERDARFAGRTSAKIGTVAGAIGSVSAISASGTVVGLSGAGITSGLAAIGGGSMLTGAAISIAAPALVAFVAGIGVYKLFKRLSN